MKKCCLILNPKSGTRQGRRFLPEVIARLSHAGYLCFVCITEARGDAAAFAAAHGGGSDLVVACGGDGTLNEVVSGLLSAGHTVPLGYLPCGSTNDFAASLGLPRGLMRACEAVAAGSPRTLDMGRFGPDRYFTYVASFGAFSSVSYSTSQNVKNILGHAAYILAGIRSLADIHPIHLKVTAGNSVHEQDYIFGAVCNSTSLGGVLRLAKQEVHMNDGLFETLLIPFPRDLIALNRIISSLTAQRYDDPSLLFLRASAFRFEGGADLKWTLDGEEAAGAPSLEIVNLPDAVRLIC